MLLASVPAAAQFFSGFQPPAPTALDVDPGIDHTALDKQLPPEQRRMSIFYRTEYPPGTIIVNTADRFLYLIMGNNVAMRYGIGVGRVGFQWGGTHVITRKAEWPDWRPPPEMITRQPYLPRFMAGGPGNPLGARALYIGTTDTVSTAPTRRRRSGRRCRRAASAWSTKTSSISTTAFRWAPPWWCSISSERCRA